MEVGLTWGIETSKRTVNKEGNPQYDDLKYEIREVENGERNKWSERRNKDGIKREKVIERWT